MLSHLHRSSLFWQRSLALGVFVATAVGSSALGCGARSGVFVDEASAGGAAPVADPPTPSLPAGGRTEPMATAGAPPLATAGAPSAAGSGGSTPVGPVKPPCESVSVAIDDLRPAVTLVVDQSRSMSRRYPNNQSPDTRWSLVGQALFDPTFGVVKTFEGSVRFGVAFFTGNSASGECPMLNELHVATKNYEALRSLYQGLAPEGDTPTGESLELIVNGLEATPSPSQQSIVLVTDGDPDTCAQPNPDNGQPEAITAVQNAYELGYDVYVLGISRDIAGQNLQQLANAGKGKPIDLVYGTDADAAQPFQASSDVKGLTAQFGDILSRIPFCEVRLQRNVAEAEASTGQVLLDGQPLSYDPVDGYVLRDPRHLAIVGKSCEAIKSGAKQLSVRIGCY